LYSYDLYSHENKPLAVHLLNVAERCRNCIQGKKLNFHYSNSELLTVASIMGLTHDIGKATRYFQDYLKDMTGKGKSNVDVNLRSHGEFSALCTYFQLKDKVDRELALTAFLCVKQHHGSLGDLACEYSYDKIETARMKKQISLQYEAIDQGEINCLLKDLSLKEMTKEGLLNCIDEISICSFDFMVELQGTGNNGTCSNIYRYILYKFLFSVLIFADKEDAILDKQEEIIYDIPFDLIDKYKVAKFKGKSVKLKGIRDKIYDDVKAEIIKSDNRIMSITVPTGAGKTLTAMSAALNLKQKLKEDMRIIYCLPFTSIIDQNFNEYSAAIEIVMGKSSDTSSRLLKHHHLAEIKYTSDENNYEGSQGKFMIESWNSQIVVTTFMQFFTTIFSNRNNQLIKFQSLANSIVLLDEVQAIPYKYWLAINNMLKVMADTLNIYFVLLTATQPLIFNKDEITELVPGYRDYFKQFKRTKLHVNLDEISFEDFLHEAEDLINKNEDKNILVVLNTVRMVQETFKYFGYMESENTKLYFLSTGIIPKERKNRISEIKDKENRKRKIVFSTQLIEAGVDIDMDIVIRALSPIDSINQTSGRCNREYEEEYAGDVYVYNVVGNNRKASIYDGFLMERTKEVLEGKKIVYEEDYLELNEAYYNAVSKYMSRDISRKLLNMINNLEFENVEKNFRLIEAQDKVSVFIEADDKAHKLWCQFKNIMSKKDPIERREEFYKLKNEFYEYVITVFRIYAREDAEYNIRYVSKEALNKSYNNTYGYILEEGDVIF